MAPSAAGHPLVAALGRTARERREALALADDLAAWLSGAEVEPLGALARVLVRVAATELEPVRALCRGRPELAAEAGAQATIALWRSVEASATVEDRRVDPIVAALGGALSPRGRDDGAEEPGAGSRAPEGGAPKAASGGGGGAGSPVRDGGEPRSADVPAPAPGPLVTEGDEVGGDARGGVAPAPRLPIAPGASSDPREPAATVGAPVEGAAPLDGAAPADRASPIPRGAADAPRVVALPSLDAADVDPLSVAFDSPRGARAIGRLVAGASAGAGDAIALLGALARLLPGVGWSVGPGAVRAFVLEDVHRFATLVAKLPDLAALADALGRSDAAEARAGPLDGGSEEVVGVTLSGDVARALPAELALLGDPSTEDLFYARYAEHRLMSLELAGSGLDGRADGGRRGPIIACVDASASMDGAPELVAKGLVLAVARRALRQRRDVHILLFGGRGQRLERRLRPGPSAVRGLLDLLASTFDGGTDFDGPLLRALDLLDERPMARADLLVLTDGQAAAAPAVVRRVAEARARHGARVVSVAIGGRAFDGVAPFSDEVVAVPATPGAPIRPVLRALKR